MRISQEIPNADFFAYFVEYFNVVLEPRTEHVYSSVAFPRGNEKGAVQEDLHVVLDRLVLQVELVRKLIQVSRSNPYGLNDPGPVFSTPLSTE